VTFTGANGIAPSTGPLPVEIAEWAVLLSGCVIPDPSQPDEEPLDGVVISGSSQLDEELLGGLAIPGPSGQPDCEAERPQSIRGLLGVCQGAAGRSSSSWRTKVANPRPRARRPPEVAGSLESENLSLP